MADNTKNLTIDSKKLMRLTVAQRAQAASNPNVRSYLETLTPVEYARLFPKYYRDKLPDIGLTAPTTGGAIPSGGGGTSTYSAAPSGGGGGGSTVGSSAATPAWLSNWYKTLGEKVDISQNETVSPDSKGRVNPTELRNSLIGKIRNSRLNGFIPPDGKKYGIENGTPQEWANYFVGLAKHESGLRTTTVGDVGRFVGNSNGLYQLSPNDALNYKFQKTPFTLEQLRDPNFNTDVAIKIHEHWIIDKKEGIKKGAGRYWGPIQRGWVPGKGRDASLPWSDWKKMDQIPSAIPGTEVQKGDASQTGAIFPTEEKKRESLVRERQAELAKTRILPITPKLKAQLDYAASQAGVEVEVFSGGQPKKGTSSNRVGSTRHDEGNAADIYLYRNGRKLSADNPEDAEIMKKFVAASIQAGVTGVGHANDYMGPSGLHVGGGKTAVWGQKGGIPSKMIVEAFEEGKRLRKNSPINALEWSGTTREKPEKKPDGYDNLPESMKKEIESLPLSERDKFYRSMEMAQQGGIDVIGNLTRVYTEYQESPHAIVQNVVESPPGQISPELLGDITILDRTRDLLTPEERRSEPGNRVVSLDFNSSAGGRGVEIVIPDNATKEERKIAEDYVSSVKKFFEDRGYKDYKIRGVKTTSENKKGKSGYFHTEPFFIQDKEAVRIITEDPAGYAQTVLSTLGRLPKARIIPPHLSDDPGAANKEISERGFAVESLIPALRNLQKKIRETPSQQQEQVEQEQPTAQPTAEVVRERAEKLTVQGVLGDLGGAKYPSLTSEELEAINATPGAAERIANGIRSNPMAKSIFATPDAISSRIRQDENYNKMLAAHRKKKKEEKEKAKAQAATPKTEQAPAAPAAPTEAPTPEQKPVEGSPTSEQKPAEEAPKAMSTGGTYNIPPGEDIAGVNLDTGKTEFYANSREGVSTELKFDPATISREQTENRVAQSDDVTNKMSIGTPSKPISDSSSVDYNSIMKSVAEYRDIGPNTPSAQRAYERTKFVEGRTMGTAMNRFGPLTA